LQVATEKYVVVIKWVPIKKN